MNDKAKHNFDEGTFEYIEAKIRRDVDDTSFGFDFEWLCKWFLENAPSYRGMFKDVWLWHDWPDRWWGAAPWDYYPYYGRRRSKDWKVNPKPKK